MARHYVEREVEPMSVFRPGLSTPICPLVFVKKTKQEINTSILSLRTQSKKSFRIYIASNIYIYVITIVVAGNNDVIRLVLSLHVSLTCTEDDY